MGGFAVHDGKKTRRLTSKGFWKILKRRPESLPDWTEESIQAQSQVDSLSKIIAVFQILGFWLKFWSRHAEGLTTSILEVSTAAYAACAIIAYGLWWKKPRLNGDPYMLRLSADVVASLPEGSLTSSRRHPYFETIDQASVADEQSRGVGVVIMTLFGAIHLFSWNSIYLSHLEEIFWRVSVIVSIVSPVIAWAVWNLCTTLETKGYLPAWSETLFIISITVIYGVLRLFMITEAFRQLLYLPDDAFLVPSWSNYLPYFS